MDLGHLVKAVFTKFLHCKITIIFFLLILFAMEANDKIQPTLKEVEGGL